MNVLVLEPYALPAISRLTTQATVSQDIKTLDQADALLIRSQTKIDKELLDKAPNLKLIVTATSGFDHIDWRLCQERGITVSYTPEANAQSAAEMTITLLLAWERNLVQAVKNVRENKWRQGLKRSEGLYNKRLGIIGLGRIGKKVAATAGTLGMHLSAYDPYAPDEAFPNAKCERLGLIELLKASDYVSLHVPLTKETKHLLNLPTFKEMQAEGVLINTSRGPVVSENDLMTALDEEIIAGAAMDVIEREPPPAGHRALTHPKLLLTPHIGAFTDSAWERASQAAVEKVLCFQLGELIMDTLPLPTPWFDKT